MITNYLNLNAIFHSTLLNPSTLLPITHKELSSVLPPRLADLEFSVDEIVPIPSRVLEIYRTYRPTTLFRAKKLEEAIGTTCRLYFKNEGETPLGSHKYNSACLIAELCKEDGIETLTTETTGNWGLALALAGKQCGIHVICFIDSDSHEKRPDRKTAMEKAGADVVVVQRDSHYHDLLTLSADAAISASQKMWNARYIFGSIYNYFVTPQTLIGLEAKDQLAQEGEYPDIVVGSCGGGANLLGTAGIFTKDHFINNAQISFFSAESENCPILSRGVPGKYSVDTLSYFPMIETLGLPNGLRSSEYIGGLGSTLVAPLVAEMHRKGMLQAITCNSTQAMNASRLFNKTEGFGLALESSYTIAAIIGLAKAHKNLVILGNISTYESDILRY